MVTLALTYNQVLQ